MSKSQVPKTCLKQAKRINKNTSTLKLAIKGNYPKVAIGSVKFLQSALKRLSRNLKKWEKENFLKQQSRSETE